jgi:hypothetical protein
VSARIFISYRREDSAATCGRIFDRLVARFGRDAVFKDVDSIPPGVDFREHIGRFLDQSAMALVVIGPQWRGVTDAQGRTRLEQPADLVRLEVEGALQRGIAVIPLLVQGAAMPGEDALPATLKPLAYRNALPVRFDPDFDTDMSRVIAAAERVVSPSATPPAAFPTPAGVPANRAWDATNDVEYRKTRPPFGNIPESRIRTVAFGRHRIDVQASTARSGSQRVFFDGTEVANGKKATTVGYKTYTFAVTEDGVRVLYEVDARVAVFGHRADVRVRCNGVEIYRD